MIAELIIIIVLLVFDALFSATESALVAISDQKVIDDAEQGHRQAILVRKYAEKSRPYATAIHMMLTIFPLVSGIMVYRIYQDLVVSSTGMGGIVGALIIVAMVSLVLVLHVMAGSLVAKAFAYKHADDIAYKLVGLAYLARFLMRPLSFLVNILSRGLGTLFGLDASAYERTMTEEEIRTIVEASGKTGVIDAEEREMIHNIFEFDDTTVDEIMTHRTEIASIDVEAPRSEIIHTVTTEKYTRFPVFEDNIDQIIGTLHVKDLLPYLDKNAGPLDIRTLIRTPYFIPESKRISDLFKEMQRDKNHIAIVLDEYGGTAGIVTVEDLIEEIVGNIFDEYDTDEEEELVKIDEDTYEVDGLMNIDDVEDIIGIGLPTEEYDTVSGFILGHLGRFPEDGEEIRFEFRHHLFEVMQVDDQIITKVRITRTTDIHGAAEEGDDDGHQ